VVQNSKIYGCVIGNNSYVGDGCNIERTLVLGNDYYTNHKTRAASVVKGESALGIGAASSSASLALHSVSREGELTLFREHCAQLQQHEHCGF